VDLFIARLNRDLDMVKACIHKFLYVIFIRKAPGIGIETCDLSVRFSMGNEFGQVALNVASPPVKTI